MQALAAAHFCACVGDSKTAVEAQRVGKFKEAIKAYEWSIAETLVMSDEESQARFLSPGSVSILPTFGVLFKGS